MREIALVPTRVHTHVQHKIMKSTRSTASKGGAGLTRQVQRAGVEPLKGGVQDGHLLPEAALGRGLCGLVEAGACGGEQARDGGPPALRIPGQTPLALKGHLGKWRG